MYCAIISLEDLKKMTKYFELASLWSRAPRYEGGIPNSVLVRGGNSKEKEENIM
jgi:hypothetical protein